MITQDNIKEILDKDLGIHCTKSSILRYQNSRLIHAPVKINNERKKGIRRVAYPSMSVVETATATLLFFGDWLTRNSKRRIGRFTVDDIYYGRLLFYKRNPSLLPRNKKRRLEYLLEEYENAYSFKKNDVPDSVKKARKRYCYEIYKATFFSVLDKVKEDIKIVEFDIK